MQRATQLLAIAASVLSMPISAAETVVSKEALMSDQARGEFDIKVVPISAKEEDLGRMSIDKTYHGDLDATGTGQMMASRDEKTGAAVYVAIETVTGSLKGRKGSFMLAHRGMMNPAGHELNVVVVPASGTDGLKGISGDLEIVIEGGKHSYVLRYTLPIG